MREEREERHLEDNFEVFWMFWLVERDIPFKPDIANSAVSFGGQAAECDRRIPILGQNDVVSLSGGYSAVVNSTARPPF